MQNKRRKFGATFKVKAALAAITGGRTIAELAGEFGVHPTRSPSGRNACWMGRRRSSLMEAEEAFGNRRHSPTGCISRLDS